MFSGPPLPLTHDFPLRQVLPFIHGNERVGIWLRDAGAPHPLLISATGRCVAVLIGEDLGALLRCCSRLVVREASAPRLLEAEELIRWRALQVVTGTPYLPSVERLNEIFPGAHPNGDGFCVPLESQPPEEILANCLTHEIPVAESRIVYRVGREP